MPLFLSFLVSPLLPVAAGGQSVVQHSLTLMEEQLRERVRIEVLPKYPTGERAARIEGVVVGQIEFDETGTVKTVDIIESTHPFFAEPASHALKQWKFEPIVTGKGEVYGGKGKITIYFRYRNGRGWTEDPLIFQKKKPEPKR
jgi:TonB family protein